jgi:post-segregation antitoxin (ccd killing protein)
METSQKVVRRIRISQNTLDQCRAYFPGLTIDKLVENALENEIRRKQKKRLINPF